MNKKFGESCTAEFLRVAKQNFEAIKSYVEKSVAQLNQDELHVSGGFENNSIAVIIQHMSGNLISRFTDFLTTDGEKADRNRDDEFVDQQISKEKLLEKWNYAWSVLFSALDDLSGLELHTTIVYVRNEPHSVIEAINRQVFHHSYHAGQIVLLAKQLKGSEWKNLSMPKRK
jgi:hypothetical protein